MSTSTCDYEYIWSQIHKNKGMKIQLSDCSTSLLRLLILYLFFYIYYILFIIHIAYYIIYNMNYLPPSDLYWPSFFVPGASNSVSSFFISRAVSSVGVMYPSHGPNTGSIPGGGQIPKKLLQIGCQSLCSGPQVPPKSPSSAHQKIKFKVRLFFKIWELLFNFYE